MTPSRSGRIAMMLAGVRPTIRFASAPISRTPPRLRVDCHDGRFADHDAPPANVDERVRGAEVDPDVAGEQAEKAVQHRAERFLTCRAASWAAASACATAVNGRSGSTASGW